MSQAQGIPETGDSGLVYPLPCIRRVCFGTRILPGRIFPGHTADRPPHIQLGHGELGDAAPHSYH
jgi:hypothetical protein